MYLYWAYEMPGITRLDLLLEWPINNSKGDKLEATEAGRENAMELCRAYPW